MLESNERLAVYLDSVVNSVFKILPLYEEQNVGVETYIESLLFELYGLDKAIKIENSYEYAQLLSILEALKMEVIKKDSKQATIKREVFKCINIIKNIVEKLKDGE